MSKEIWKARGLVAQRSSLICWIAGACAKCRQKPNNSSANARLPESLAQSITTPAGLLRSICSSLSDNGSGVSLEGNSLTGRKKITPTEKVWIYEAALEYELLTLDGTLLTLDIPLLSLLVFLFLSWRNGIGEDQSSSRTHSVNTQINLAQM